MTKANAVISGLDVDGAITVEAPNVTIKDSKIHGAAYYGVLVKSGNVTVSDSELYGQSAAAIAFDNWTGIRLNIHSVKQDGLKVGSNTTLEDSYLHDFTPSAGAHADGAQMSGVSKNVLIEHNYIDPGTTEINSALFLVPEDGGNANGPITVTDNILGGGGWTVYLGGKSGTTQNGYLFTNNRFLGDNRFGLFTYSVAGERAQAFSGNVVNSTPAVAN